MIPAQENPLLCSSASDHHMLCLLKNSMKGSPVEIVHSQNGFLMEYKSKSGTKCFTVPLRK